MKTSRAWRPSDPPYQLPKWWRERLVSWLEINRPRERGGWTRLKLAAEVGCDSSMLTRIIKGEQKSSFLVAAICRVTQLPLPQEDTDPELTEGYALLRKLKEKRPDAYAEAIRQWRILLSD